MEQKNVVVSGFACIYKCIFLIIIFIFPSFFREKRGKVYSVLLSLAEKLILKILASKLTPSLVYHGLIRALLSLASYFYPIQLLIELIELKTLVRKSLYVCKHKTLIKNIKTYKHKNFDLKTQNKLLFYFLFILAVSSDVPLLGYPQKVWMC